VQNEINIIVVEDEPTQRLLLVDYLTDQGFQVTGLADGAALRLAVQAKQPDLVMLDLHLPDENGFSLARHLRKSHPRVAIIMVTAAGNTMDRITGLDIGADDYISKPFEPRELLARVKSVLRRTGPVKPISGPGVPMGRCLLDLVRHVLILADGTEEKLAASEFDLLKLFAENPNRPLNRESLLELTRQRDGEALDRAIDLRITRLRRKIEHNPSSPDAIRTVRGVGYMFVPPS